MLVELHRCLRGFLLDPLGMLLEFLRVIQRLALDLAGGEWVWGKG